MDSVSQRYEQIVQKFTCWAQAEERIRAAIVIGSRARQDHPADRWSDLDIAIFTASVDHYCQASGWTEAFGEPWLSFLEPTPGGGGMERRVLYDGWLDVDFAFFSTKAAQQMVQNPAPSDFYNLLGRGTRVLLDRDGLVDTLAGVQENSSSPTPPKQSEFLNIVNDFWYHAVWTAKHLRRGELWWAKGCCDGKLKTLLGRMMEWHARATKGPAHDTWMRGRFLEEWADSRAVAALPDIFAHYDREDIWRALEATMNLFHWLAVETARLLCYPYPSPGDQRATAFVKTRGEPSATEHPLSPQE